MMEVPIHENVNKDDFFEVIYPLRRPVILRGEDLGPCTQKWTPKYLCDVGHDRPVVVHWGNCKQMDFISKNFKYIEMKFDEFVKRASETVEIDTQINGEVQQQQHQQQQQQQQQQQKRREWFYLRSLGSDPRKDVSDISVKFPELAVDFRVPPFVPDGAFFSSVFRIASPGMQLWTHYDVMDNILIQVKGRKRVVLFPPTDALFLYLKGDKSLVIDIDKPDLQAFPLFSQVTRFECFLEPGDILFIPALWFHNVISLDFGIAVNIFWRHLSHDLYDPKDVYGNKDPIPASRVMQSLDKNIQHLEKLPQEYRDFYARRMIARIQEKCFVKNE